ncbi:hypothetical protein EVAR_23421_1 [Eumeta japonica]|uniref:ZAD domain-containing protein n=1 Tax=Eumeta variegata TaxID=151549 RepID=A0A4C1VVI3_EUMVA|nr:hypothetical protein EVAR_23421_1 [Eumeta japonica]
MNDNESLKGGLHNGYCRCCLDKGYHLNIKAEHYWDGVREVYADIIEECFGVSVAIDREDHTLLICSSCVQRVREASHFRIMVHRHNPLDWNHLTELLRQLVREYLKLNKNRSKTNRLALAKFMEEKFWKNRSPKDPANIQNFKDARKELLDIQEKEDEEECQHLFSQMHRE